MKIHKLTVSVLDFDNMGAAGVSAALTGARFANDCIDPKVHEIESRDIGPWSDDHPLNFKDTAPTEFARLFSHPTPTTAEKGALALPQGWRVDTTENCYCVYSPSGDAVCLTPGDGHPAAEVLRQLCQTLLAAQPVAQTDESAEKLKVERDVLLYGHGVTVNGKHVPLDQVVITSAISPAPTGMSVLRMLDQSRPTDDELWDKTIRDRDTYHEWADKLAEAISKYFGVDIGEHSNDNLPWSEALEAIESADPVASKEAVSQRPEYPEGDVVGACVCGSWPGGKCLKCPTIAAEGVPSVDTELERNWLENVIADMRKHAELTLFKTPFRTGWEMALDEIETRHRKYAATNVAEGNMKCAAFPNGVALDLSGLTRYDHEPYESPNKYENGRYVLFKDVEALVAAQEAAKPSSPEFSSLADMAAARDRAFAKPSEGSGDEAPVYNPRTMAKQPTELGKYQYWAACQDEPLTPVAAWMARAALAQPAEPGGSDGWISVKDRLPVEGQFVLMCGPIQDDMQTKVKGWRDIGYYRADDFMDGRGCTRNSATHWMPAPDSHYDQMTGGEKGVDHA